MENKNNLGIFTSIIILSLMSPSFVCGQNITITDSSKYPSTGIDASRADDKLVDNTVLIDLNSNQEIYRFVSYGANSDKNDSNYDLHGNKTYIENGKFSYVSIYGSASKYRFIYNNLVQIDNGTFRKSSNGINGGYSITGTVYNNEVLINNGNFDGIDVSGGYSQYGSISKNSVIINDGKFKGYSDIYGGNSKDIGIVSDNSVIVNNVTEGTFDGIYGGFSTRGLVARNNVTINADIYAFDVVGGYGDHNNLSAVYNNTVNINKSNSTIYYKLAGGYNYKGSAFNNVVNITDSVLEYSSVYGGMTRDGITTNNMVIVNRSNISGDIIGGYAGGNHDSKGNVVEVIDSNVNGNIFGGYSDSGSANDNTVVLEGINDKKYSMDNAYIGGGYSGSGNISNNRLVVDSWQGSVNNISNFSEIVFGNLNFVNGDTILKITGPQSTDLSNTKITGRWINFNFDAPEQHIGESIHLVQNDNGILFNNIYDKKVKVEFQEGLTHNIYGDLYNNKEQNSIDFTINGKKQSNQLKLMTYNRNVGMAIVNQGSDLLNDIFMMKDNIIGYDTFAAMQGNFSRYNVGGNSDVNGWSGLFGVSDNKKYDSGILTYGIFYENGMGNYSDYNCFNDGYFRFDGSAVYNGGGILARYVDNNGVYTQADVRTGSIKNELKNGLYDKSGKSYGYINDNRYYGIDFSLGKIFEINDRLKFNLFGNFNYVHFDDSSFSITGDSFTNDFYFGNADSKRLRIGGRFINNTADNWKLFYGAAYEYEFDGRTNISTQDEIIDDDGGIGGSTVIGEVGVNYHDPKNPNLDINAYMRGYSGNRQGFSANLQAFFKI